MTVKELIDKLKEYPQDLEVWSLDDSGYARPIDKESIDVETIWCNEVVMICGE